MTIEHAEDTPDPGLAALLAGYVSGTLPQPLNVLLASHLEMSAKNRGFVRALEAAAGHAIETSDEIAPINGRDARLDAIFALPAALPAVNELPIVEDAVLPSPLRRYLGTSLENLAWKGILPGIREYRISEKDGTEATLIWIRAGQRVPTHTHDGTEVTLLLKGGFKDASGHYTRGDVALADEEIDHRPVADEGEDCLCFAIIDAPLRLTGPFGRFVQPFLKR